MVNLMPFFYAWGVLVLAIVCLALYRKYVSMHEDNYLHLDEAEARQIPKQVAVFHTIENVDRVGKALTIFAATAGVVLALVYMYTGWTQHR